MENNFYSVYVKLDESNNIIAVSSSAFVDESWGTKIDQGTDSLKHKHAQGNYLEKPVFTIDGIPQYKLVENKPVERSEEEINKDKMPIIKESKITELRIMNDQAIDNGTTVTLSTGEENFTYTLADQSNISEMFMAVIMGATEYSYHQNGESCRMFNAGDIMTLYGTLSMYKTGLLTYFNQLKNYVGTLTSVEDIQAVTYGQELTGEYLASYNDLMAKNKAQLDKVIENLTQKGE